MIRFTEKNIILVAGASSGIGKTTALRLNDLGARVLVVARSADKLEEVKRISRVPDNCETEVKDLVADIESLPAWIMEMSKKYGKLCGLVIAAGKQQIQPLKALSIDKSKELFDINYFANLFLVKGFCDRRVNIGRESSIVMISSTAAITGNPGIVNYSASKGAIDAAVRSLAVEIAREGIRINSVLPGFVKTEMTDGWSEIYDDAFIEEMKKKTPLGLGRTEDICDLICFLLSTGARWITGQNIVVDGGASL